METKKPFLQNSEIIYYFPDAPKSDLFIRSIGYHNFQQVKPCTFFRSQRFYTLHFVLSGEGILMVGGKNYDVGKGGIFILPNDVDFCYYPKEDNPWEYVFIEFNGNSAKEYVQAIGFTMHTPVFECFEFTKLETLLFDCFKSGKPTHFKGLALLHLLFDSTIFPYENQTNISEDKLVEKVKMLIESKYFTCDFGAEDVVRLTHFSHSYLCRIFKKHTGKTIVSYLNERRMQEAEKLLKNTNLSIIAISQMVGYKEYTYFLMLFKKMHGATPLQYRRNSFTP